MAEQHDVDQRGQLPEEDLAAQPEHHGSAVDVGDGDGQGDERHHPGLLVPSFADEALQERPAAVEVDSRGEEGLDVGVAGERQEALDPQEALNERRQRQDRQGQGERDPEATSEVRHHVGVVVVTALSVVIVSQRWPSS